MQNLTFKLHNRTWRDSQPLNNLCERLQTFGTTYERGADLVSFPTYDLAVDIVTGQVWQVNRNTTLKASLMPCSLDVGAFLDYLQELTAEFNNGVSFHLFNSNLPYIPIAAIHNRLPAVLNVSSEVNF